MARGRHLGHPLGVNATPRICALALVVLSLVLTGCGPHAQPAKQTQATNTEALVSVAERAKEQEKRIEKRMAAVMAGIMADERTKAEQGDVQSQYELGMSYKYGSSGLPTNAVVAAMWYRKAAEQGHVKAQTSLASMYFYGEGLAEDRVEGLKWYRKAAEQGDALASSSLGRIYSLGEIYNLGLPKDYLAEAVKWYRKAIEQGDMLAQYSLTHLYFYQVGVPKDTEAVNWIRGLADKGDARAQSGLAVMYSTGDGMPRNVVEAAKWYRKAAEQGHAEAQHYLGNSYYYGSGVPKNLFEAVQWYRKSAEQGNPLGQVHLGFMYYKGEAVPKEFTEAANWYLRAAKQGNRESQWRLGWMYERGQGLLQNQVEAYKWYNLAAAMGDQEYRKFRDDLQTKMTPSQIAEGQRLAREYHPKWEGNSAQTGPADAPQSAADIPFASGSGFFITADGWLVTNAHVVEGGSTVRVLTALGLLPAQVVHRDAASDLALLKVAGTFDALPVAASRSVKLGQTVATVGFPNTGLQGFSPKLAKGEVASVAGAHDDPRHFQISVPVQPGNSGGPLVDTKGNVVGVVVAKLSAKAALATSGALPENVNYAVKSSFLLGFLESAPEINSKLKEVNTSERSFEDTVATVQKATALVLVYR